MLYYLLWSDRGPNPTMLLARWQGTGAPSTKNHDVLSVQLAAFLTTSESLLQSVTECRCQSFVSASKSAKNHENRELRVHRSPRETRNCNMARQPDELSDVAPTARRTRKRESSTVVAEQ